MAASLLEQEGNPTTKVQPKKRRSDSRLFQKRRSKTLMPLDDMVKHAEAALRSHDASKIKVASAIH